MITYRAEIGTIRRTSDGALSTCWGLRDTTTGQPVLTDAPAPWTHTDPQGGVWEHVGGDVTDLPGAVLLFHASLDHAIDWVRAHGPARVLVGRQSLHFAAPAEGPPRRAPGVSRYYCHHAAGGAWLHEKPWWIVDRDADMRTVAMFADEAAAKDELDRLNGEES